MTLTPASKTFWPKKAHQPLRRAKARQAPTPRQIRYCTLKVEDRLMNNQTDKAKALNNQLSVIWHSQVELVAATETNFWRATSSMPTIAVREVGIFLQPLKLN